MADQSINTGKFLRFGESVITAIVINIFVSLYNINERGTEEGGLYDPAQPTTTPSLISRVFAGRLRMALGALLFINIIHFMMTATTTSTSDFVLAFLGYYGQDLMRPGALHIFFWLAIVSPVADLFVLLIELLTIQVTWLNIFAIVLTVFEVIIKIAAAVFSRSLRNHLLSMPGQSV